MFYLSLFARLLPPLLRWKSLPLPYDGVTKGRSNLNLFSKQNPLMTKRFHLTFTLALVLPLTVIVFVGPHAKPCLAQQSEPALQQAQSLSRAFESVAKTITPALVNIRAISKPVTSQRLHGSEGELPSLPPGVPAPFRDFFEHFGRQRPFNGDPTPQQGLGSGVIVDSDGHILTNNHVVENADEVTVRLSDGRSFDATIVGTDKRTDLAVIKIDAPQLTPAALGDSDILKIGEWVVAAGTPFGLENTITAGIVSAKGRSILGGSAYEDFIQTDAAINPGNSGGPLANLNGEVIGINTAIFSRSGGYMGVGFAIPINMARRIMKSLISEGKVVRGWLGVVIQELSTELADSFQYDSTKGALISEIAEDGPAAKGDLQQGDIITAFNGKEIASVNDLRNMVAAERPGTRVPITVFRNGKQKRIHLKLGELPGGLEVAADAPEEEAETPNYESSLGIHIEPLTEQMRAELKARTQEGVVVTRVDPSSPAAEANVRIGDIVKSINGKRVASLKEFQELLEQANLTKGVRLLLESGGIDRFVFIREK